MGDFQCAFCGSKTLLIDTPYVERTNEWPVSYAKKQTYCCKPQAKNQEYMKKHYHSSSDRPSSEEVSKE